MEIPKFQMESIRLALDFGFFILAALVQWIIYPSFFFIDSAQLKEWHGRYTNLISYFVAPMLFLQSGLIAYQLFNYGYSFFIDLVLLAGVWINTFFYAVPLHKALDSNLEVNNTIQRLIKVNKSRTLMWFFLFLISFSRFLGI